MQRAVVMTHSDETMTHPQIWVNPLFFSLICRLHCQGQEWGGAVWPPTIRVMIGRTPHSVEDSTTNHPHLTIVLMHFLVIMQMYFILFYFSFIHLFSYKVTRFLNCFGQHVRGLCSLLCRPISINEHCVDLINQSSIVNSDSRFESISLGSLNELLLLLSVPFL